MDSALSDIFGPPPLYEGESVEDYNLLYGRLRAAVSPEDIIDEILVRDIMDLSWETLRLRRLKAKLMDVEAGKRLRQNIYRMLGQPTDRAQLLQKWEKGEAVAKKRISDVLNKGGFDHETNEVQSFSARLDDFERIDRLIAHSEVRRNNALREIDRHRDSVARRLREVIEDAEFEEISTGDPD